MRNVLLFSLVVLGIASANADSLTYTATPTGAAFMYGFTLSNTGDTGGTLFDLFLSIPVDVVEIDTSTIGAPVGWGDPTGGLLFFGPDTSPSTSFIEWADDVSGLYDIGIGSSLGGFSFLSSQEIADSITFALDGSTTFNTAEPISTVPEPSLSAVWELAGLYLACAVIKKRLRDNAVLSWQVGRVAGYFAVRR
jgi:hypothetical protein